VALSSFVDHKKNTTEVTSERDRLKTHMAQASTTPWIDSTSRTNASSTEDLSAKVFGKKRNLDLNLNQ
jgi:hypothetical protein